MRIGEKSSLYFDDYYNNERLLNRSKHKTLSDEDLATLVNLVEDVKANIDFETFLIKYGNLDIKFPS